MPVTKNDLMQRFELPSATVTHCEEMGILRTVHTGDLVCYTPASFLRMEIYLKGKSLGLSIGECRALIDQAEEDSRVRQIAYARQMAAKAGRNKKPN